MGLDHLLMLEVSPLRNMLPRLTALAVTAGLLLADSLSPMAEGQSEWINGADAPTQAQIQREMESLREQLINATPDVVLRRRQMCQTDGVRFDRRLHGVIMCIYELSYFETFPMLEVLGQHLRSSQVEIQRTLLAAETESFQ